MHFLFLDNCLQLSAFDANAGGARTQRWHKIILTGAQLPCRLDIAFRIPVHAALSPGQALQKIGSYFYVTPEHCQQYLLMLRTSP